MDKWESWDHIINDSIKDFLKTFNIYPNIIVANSHTYSQFDFITNINPKKRIKARHNITEKPPELNENIGLDGFEDSNYSLDFAEDNNLKDKYFMLIYDSEPEWDEIETNPITEIDTEPILEKAIDLVRT